MTKNLSKTWQVLCFYSLYFFLIDHQIQDCNICIFHSNSSYVSHISDCILNIITYQSFSCLKTMICILQSVCHNCCIYCWSDFSSTWRLSSITYNATCICKSICDCFRYCIVITTVLPGYGSSCSTCGTYCSTVSWQTSNISFLMNRY